MESEATQPNESIIDTAPPSKKQHIETLKVKSFEVREVEIKSLSKTMRFFHRLLGKKEKLVTSLAPIVTTAVKYQKIIVDTFLEEKKNIENKQAESTAKSTDLKPNKLIKFLSKFLPKSSKSKKGNLGNYNDSRDKLELDNHRDLILKENEKQTSLLEDISKQESSSDSSKGWLATLLSNLLALSVAKIIKPLSAIKTLLGGMKLLGGLGGGKNKNILTKKDNKKGKGRGIGIAKKLGAIGMVVSGVMGISDYKEWKGLSKEYNTTIREKITGALGGIANGFNDFVKFISMGTVDLFDKNETFEVIDNVTSNIKESFENMLVGFPTIQASINLFTNGVNSLLNKASDGFSKIYDWGVEFTRTQTEDEKNFVKSSNKRKVLEEGYNEEQGFFESDKEYNKRRKTLKKELLKLKEEELLSAKKALDNEDFNSNSRFRADAVLVVNKDRLKKSTKQVREYSKWSKEKEVKVEQIKVVKEKLLSFSNKLESTTLSARDKEILGLNIQGFSLSLKNLTKQLEEIEIKKPQVEKYKPIENISATNNSSSSRFTHLLNTISNGEGTSDRKAKSKGYSSGYDVTLGYGAYADDKSKAISTMTIGELKKLQSEMLNHKDNKLKSSASGKYQITKQNLLYLQKKMNISDDEIFSPQMQDRMAENLIMNKRHGKDYLNGKITKAQFQKNLALEWDSVAVDKGGMNANKKYQHVAKTKHRTINNAISTFKDMPSRPVRSNKVSPTKSKSTEEKSYLANKTSSKSTNEVDSNIEFKEEKSYLANKTSVATISTDYKKNNLSAKIKEAEALKAEQDNEAKKPKTEVVSKQSETVQETNKIVQAINNQSTQISNIITAQPAAKAPKEDKGASNIVFNTSIHSREVGV